MWHTVSGLRDFHCAKLSFSTIATKQKKLWAGIAKSLNRLSTFHTKLTESIPFLELNSNLVFLVGTIAEMLREVSTSHLVTEADVDNEHKVERELTWLRDNHSKSAGSNATLQLAWLFCVRTAPGRSLHYWQGWRWDVGNTRLDTRWE